VNNRRAWDAANKKYVVESDAVLASALGSRGTLFPVEQSLLQDVLASSAVVVHLQSGNATDDFGLLAMGASSVVGVDFSAPAATSAQGRATAAGVDAAYVVGDALAVPLASGCADLVYTGKGALMWLSDLDVWAAEVRRLLRPGGWCFVYEAHPMAALWTRDADVARLDPTVDYFGGTRVNTTFPASGIARFGDADTPDAVEHQWTLSAVLGALLTAGLTIRHVGEYAEPFWRPADGSPAASAWNGTLPNSLSVLAERPSG
jgi:SAM-dependent methyltransferase